MRHNRLSKFALAALTAGPLVAAALVSPASAAAAPAPEARPLAKGLISPLSLAVTGTGTAFISQNFAGSIVKKAPGKKAKVVFEAAKPRKTEVGALSVKKGVVTFATTKGAQTDVWKRSKNGKVSKVANIDSYESSANPDGDVEYGFRDLSAECEEQIPEEFGPASYTGIVESHPYATTRRGPVTYVADAAANAVLTITDGTVETLAVLDPVPSEVTAEMAEQFGLPECVAGETHWSEPVPTDVEVGPDGNLYVTTLPGGAAGEGPNAAVTRIHRVSGAAQEVASGLITATGLAVAGNGDMYVAQLFAGSVAKIPAGSDTAEVFKSSSMPGDVELSGGKLYATTSVLSEDPPNGKLVRWGL